MKNNQKGFIVPLLVTIIAILVLGGGYYLYSNNKKVGNSILSTNIETSTSNQTPKNNTLPISNQGVIVTSIKSNDLVKLPITIEGYLDGTGWGANEGEVGIVEIFDGNGKSISSKEIISATSDWLKFPTNFKAIVGDREMMSYIKTDSGVVKIISNGAKDGEQMKYISIPVRFK